MKSSRVLNMARAKMSSLVRGNHSEIRFSLRRKGFQKAKFAN